MAASTPLRDLFPATAAERNAVPGIWEMKVDPGTVDGVRDLYSVIVLLENTSQDLSVEALVRTARALRGDLLRMADQEPRPIAEADLHALLHATTLGPARVGVASGRVNVAYDWLRWSLTTTWETDGEHDMHVEWLSSAAASHVDDAADQIVRPWLLALYQYDWLTAGLASVAEELVRPTLAVAINSLSGADFDLAGVLLTWASNRSLDADVAAELRKIGGFLATVADNQALGPATRLQALRPLALCGGSVTGQNQKHRNPTIP